MSSDSFAGFSDKRSEGFPAARGPFEVTYFKGSALPEKGLSKWVCVEGQRGLQWERPKPLPGGSWLQSYLNDLICIKIGSSKELESILFSFKRLKSVLPLSALSIALVPSA